MSAAKYGMLLPTMAGVPGKGMRRNERLQAHFMRSTLAKPAHILRSDRSPEPALTNKPGKLSALAVCRRSLCRLGNQRLLLTVFAVAVLLTLAARFLEREWALWLGERAPISWERAASTRTMQRLDSTVLSPSTLPLDRQNLINTEFAALRIPQGEPPLYELVFRHGGAFGIRSFTLSGGQIVVTDEWVQQFSNDRALLGALAVQLGHLRNHDALRSSVDKAPMSMLLALFRGDAEAGTRIMSDSQPVLQHDEHCEEEARQFSSAVMQVNP
jgi:Zn-dependent protease with chaperone function